MSYITIEFPERKEIRINGCDSVTLDQADVLRAIHGLPEAERLKFTATLLETHMNIQHFSVEDKKKVHDWALNLATRIMKNLIETDYKSALSGLTNINPGKEFLKSLRKDEEYKKGGWPGSDKHTYNPPDTNVPNMQNPPPPPARTKTDSTTAENRGIGHLGASRESIESAIKALRRFG